MTMKEVETLGAPLCAVRRRFEHRCRAQYGQTSELMMETDALARLSNRKGRQNELRVCPERLYRIA